MNQISYISGNGIKVNSITYPSFALACKQFNIPRQQTLRAFRKTTFTSQESVDKFFDEQQKHYSSDKYQEKRKRGEKFRDGRVSPINYKRASFRSKALLAQHFGCRPNPFKTRLAVLEEHSISITDDVIEIATKPLSNSEMKITWDSKTAIVKLNRRFFTTLNPGTTTIHQNHPDNILTLPLTALSVLFNVHYETLKRQVYDIKLNASPTPLDIIVSLSTLNPRGYMFELEGIQYSSIFELMQKAKYKLSKDNALRLIAKAKATIS